MGSLPRGLAGSPQPRLLARFPSLLWPLRPDEAGFLHGRAQLGPGPDSLYGPYWVDRPTADHLADAGHRRGRRGVRPPAASAPSGARCSSWPRRPRRGRWAVRAGVARPAPGATTLRLGRGGDRGDGGERPDRTGGGQGELFGIPLVLASCWLSLRAVRRVSVGDAFGAGLLAMTAVGLEAEHRRRTRLRRGAAPRLRPGPPGPTACRPAVRCRRRGRRGRAGGRRRGLGGRGRRTAGGAVVRHGLVPLRRQPGDRDPERRGRDRAHLGAAPGVRRLPGCCSVLACLPVPPPHVAAPRRGAGRRDHDDARRRPAGRGAERQLLDAVPLRADPGARAGARPPRRPRPPRARAPPGERWRPWASWSPRASSPWSAGPSAGWRAGCRSRCGPARPSPRPSDPATACWSTAGGPTSSGPPARARPTPTCGRCPCAPSTRASPTSSAVLTGSYPPTWFIEATFINTWSELGTRPIERSLIRKYEFVAHRLRPLPRLPSQHRRPGAARRRLQHAVAHHLGSVRRAQTLTRRRTGIRTVRSSAPIRIRPRRPEPSTSGSTAWLSALVRTTSPGTAGARGPHRLQQQARADAAAAPRGVDHQVEVPRRARRPRSTRPSRPRRHRRTPTRLSRSRLQGRRDVVAVAGHGG